jgi:Taurine catabolism dioxygenase TauD, TfdA family
MQTISRPLLFKHDGHIILNFGRIHVLGEELTDDGTPLPKPTSKQLEALEVLQRVAEKHQLRLYMVPGDIAFINNFALLHAREAFVDTPEATRHLVRLWLKNQDKAWSLPRALQKGNNIVFDTSAQQIWNILPSARVTFKLRDKFGP